MAGTAPPLLLCTRWRPLCRCRFLDTLSKRKMATLEQKSLLRRCTLRRLLADKCEGVQDNGWNCDARFVTIAVTLTCGCGMCHRDMSWCL